MPPEKSTIGLGLLYFRVWYRLAIPHVILEIQILDASREVHDSLVNGLLVYVFLFLDRKKSPYNDFSETFKSTIASSTAS
jgi:hypothetical protein